jgi:hypothetical protein
MEEKAQAISAFDAETASMHRSFRSLHPKTFLCMDILVVLALCFNLGALILTNVLVQQEPGNTVVEANPVAAKLHGYETNKEAQKYFYGFMLWAMKMSLVAGLYWYYRNRILSLQITVAVLCYILVLDFGNNLGILISILRGG